MISIRRILCPLDFSRYSRHALEQAVAIARETGADIVALHAHAIEPVTRVVTVGAPIPLEPARLTSADRQAVARELEDFTRAVDADGLVVATQVVERNPVDAIVETAERWPADLIVVGTHGRTGVERLMLGSVAEKVLRKTSCPVLTVPRRVVTPKHGLTFARILCPIDLSRASLRALDYAVSLAAAEGPGVHTLNVVELLSGASATRDAAVLDTPDFRAGVLRTARERLHAIIPDRLRALCPIIESVTFGKAGREILRVAHEEESDLIVLGVEHRSAADLLVFGSTTQEVMRQAACPVLTIRGDS